LLRIIAGLEIPDGGNVLYQDEDATHKPAGDRNVGFVFQHYALFRHMTVYENVAFALRVRHRPKAKVESRVRELLHLIQLEGMERRYPAQLSGGQRQRVALARALAAEPKVLLLDEPFGALDAKVRQELRQWLRRLHDEIRLTTVFVTHDQEEAFEVADKVVIMRAGRIEQVGTPAEIFEQPANAFVMDFLGNVNVFHGRVENGLFHSALENVDGAILGSLQVAFPSYNHEEALPAAVYIRPHELEITLQQVSASSLKARVLHLNPAGLVVKVQLVTEHSAKAISVEVGLARCAELGLQTGATVYVAPNRARVFLPRHPV
jgi:sulfate transport system ATP-binding protein